MPDDELISYIDDKMRLFNGRIGRENLHRLSAQIRREEKSGQVSELAQRSHDLMSAYINMKHGIAQTLLKIRREVMLRDPRNSDPTADK
jgi:hypothetical protein